MMSGCVISLGHSAPAYVSGQDVVCVCVAIAGWHTAAAFELA